MQGLVLGLLADSKHTKRYNKLQDFIQKGHNRAIVQVGIRAVEMLVIVFKHDSLSAGDSEE